MRTVASWTLAVTVALWLVGAVMQRRIGVAPALGLQSVAAAAAVLVALS